ncbi:kinase-like protein [Atractiella rhizophila]|nr:kinase-like protein [Atractiella rhizophila]
MVHSLASFKESERLSEFLSKAPELDFRERQGFEVGSIFQSQQHGKQIRLLRHEKRRLVAVVKRFPKPVCDESMISEYRQEERVAFQLCNALKKEPCPFVQQLKMILEQETSVCLVTEFLQGGDLLALRMKRTLTPMELKFVALECFLGVDFLHRNSIIHRDLKPANIGISSTGHIRLMDWDYSIDVPYYRYTLCAADHDGFQGTPGYNAPELFLERPHTRLVDYFSLGIIISEMINRNPFVTNPHSFCTCLSDDEYSSYAFRVLNEEFCANSWSGDGIMKDWNNRELSSVADLIQRLTKKDPKKRLGKDFYKDILNHHFFSCFDSIRKNEPKKWKALLTGDFEAPASFLDSYEDEADVKKFQHAIKKEWEPLDVKRCWVFHDTQTKQ